MSAGCLNGRGRGLLVGCSWWLRDPKGEGDEERIQRVRSEVVTEIGKDGLRWRDTTGLEVWRRRGDAEREVGEGELRRGRPVGDGEEKRRTKGEKKERKTKERGSTPDEELSLRSDPRGALVPRQ